MKRARRVNVSFYHNDNLPNDASPTGETPGVTGECDRCHHVASSFGKSSRSFRRVCALLREQCPMAEANFYTYPEREQERQEQQEEQRENDEDNAGYDSNDIYD